MQRNAMPGHTPTTASSMRLSNKYWSESRLGFSDNIANEALFYDPGYLAASSTLPSTVPPLAQLIAPNSSWGEVMVVDMARDAALCEFIAELKSSMSRLTDTAMQYAEVSEAVAQRHGGQRADIQERTEAELKRLQRQAGSAMENRGFEVLIGSLKFGVCRHRALLYKVCCDALGLECSLLRGEFNRYGRGGAHAWNVVRIYNEAKVADVMNKPGTFLEDTSDEVRAYKRVVEQGNWSAKGGAGLSAGLKEAQRPPWYIPAGDIQILKQQNGREWKLGEGPYGCVYKARLRGTEVVAVKRLNASKGGMELFSHELEMLQKLRHEHIVTFRGACHDAGNRLLVTEFAAGGDLASARHEYPDTFAWDIHGLRVCLHVARALFSMHSNTPPVVHNDLNPHNILLTEGFAAAKVADVGLAKLHSTSSVATKQNTASHANADAYAAPEVRSARGGVTEKVDIFSFGVLLHEAVQKRVPAGPGSSVRQLPPGCPQALGKLIEQCLATQPASRPSAADLVRQLEDLVEAHCKPWRGVLGPKQAKPARSPASHQSEGKDLEQEKREEVRRLQDAARRRQAASGSSDGHKVSPGSLGAAPQPSGSAIVIKRDGTGEKKASKADIEKLKADLRECLQSTPGKVVAASARKGGMSNGAMRTDLEKELQQKRHEALAQLADVESSERKKLWENLEAQLGKIEGQIPSGSVPEIKEKLLGAVRELKGSQGERRRNAERDTEQQILKHVQEQKQAQAQLNRQLEAISPASKKRAEAGAGPKTHQAAQRLAAGSSAVAVGKPTQPAGMSTGTKPSVMSTAQIRGTKSEAQVQLQQLRREQEAKLADMENRELRALAQQAKEQVAKVSGALTAPQLQDVNRQCRDAEQQLRKQQQGRRKDLERQLDEAARKIKAMGLTSK